MSLHVFPDRMGHPRHPKLVKDSVISIRIPRQSPNLLSVADAWNDLASRK